LYRAGSRDTLSGMQPAPTGRALLLDLGGVVLRNGRELVRGRVVDDDPALADYVERLDFAGAGDELWQAMLRHEVTERAYWAHRAGEIGQLLGHADWSTYDLITWLYQRPESDWLNDEVIELMLDTKAAGLPLVALTNDLVDFHGQAWADAQSWLKHFDTVVDGSLTGLLKPEPEAYRIAIRAVGVPAEEIVYLDDMPWNVAGGLAVGLQAIEVRYDDRHAAVAEARRRLGLRSTDSQPHH
jgi:putative hydrolase of the HAD superfamily